MEESGDKFSASQAKAASTNRPSNGGLEAGSFWPLKEKIGDGRFFDEYRGIKTLRERAVVLNEFYGLLRMVDTFEAGPGRKDTQGDGIYERYPEIFLACCRVRNSLELERLGAWGVDAGLRVHLSRMIRLYATQVQSIGEEAIAHLLLSHQAFVALASAGILAVPDLERLISNNWSGIHLTNQTKGEIKMKLAEWKRLSGG